MSKKYLKGFSNFGFLPVTLNEVGGYTVDDSKYTTVPGGKSCSPTDNKTDYSIPADDGVWDSGSDWTDTTLVVTVAETELDVLSSITGAKFDSETDKIMDEGTLDESPEVALTFSALRRDGGYRLYRYYAARCTGYKVSHTTKGENNDAQSYELTFKCVPRKSDNLIRSTKDVEKGDSLTWIKKFAIAESQTSTNQSST